MQEALFLVRRCGVHEVVTGHVDQQNVGAEVVGEVEVLPAVAVGVEVRNGMRPAHIAHPGLVRDVGEPSCAVVPV